MSRLQRFAGWLPALIRRVTGVDERTSRLAAVMIAVIVTSCAAQAVADVASSIWQTAKLESDNAAARKGYIARTNAIIANHRTIIGNESILCRAQKLAGCDSTVHVPADH